LRPYARPAMPKPTKTKREKKGSHLHVRLTDELKGKLELAAAREGMDLSTYARHSMIQRARELGIEV
jgi:uncharacterized protein (DUF1778 family)